MKWRDVVKTALGNLTRHKARTALTTVGVVVGILTIVTMVSLGIGVQQEMRAAFDSVGLESIRLYPVAEEANSFDLFGETTRTKLLTPDLARQLEAREDVVEVIPVLRLPQSVRMTLRDDDQEAQARPWGPFPGNIPDPFQVRPKTLAGVETPPPEGGGMVITQGLADNLGYGSDELTALLGQEIEVVLYAPRGESQVFALDVVGVTDQRQSRIAIALPDRLDMLTWWFNDPDYMENRGYDEIFIRADSLNSATHVVDWLSDQGFLVDSLKGVLDLANRGMIIVQTMLGSVGGLALFVASIGIANTMIMAVYERTKEIGILKAIGAAPSQIRALFIVEASLIGLLGGVIGTILGWLLGKILNVAILEYMRWQEIVAQGTYFVVTWWLVLGALVFATLIGLAAGLYPAARAARLAPLDALRHE